MIVQKYFNLQASPTNLETHEHPHLDIFVWVFGYQELCHFLCHERILVVQTIKHNKYINTYYIL